MNDSLMSTRLRRGLLLWAFKVAEMLLAGLAFLAACVLAQKAPFTLSSLVDAAAAAPVFLVFSMFVCHGVLLTRGLYASHRLEGLHRELRDLLICVLLAVSVVTAGALFWNPVVATSDFVLLFWAVLSLVLVLERGLLRRLLERLHAKGRNLRFALIVGAGERALRLARTLQSRDDLGYRVVGCVDDMDCIDAAVMPRLGSLDQLSKVLSETVVDEVFIALPMRSSYERIQQAVLRCEEQGALVTMPTDFFSARLARTRMGEIGLQPVLYLSAIPENDWRLLIKRGVDFFGVLLLIMLLAPVMAAVAVAVRLNSPGPAVFKQVRVGLNKRPFTLYKFRTMVQDAEAAQAALEALNEASGPVFKIRKDPRITSIGSFLRRTSLDELPQLFNVLKNEMSLVGPRPLPLRDVDGFREDWQRRRFSILPGITCLWQLSGRSNISFERWMEMDLQYIDEWSLWLDVCILLKTARAVIKRDGAY